MDGASGVSFLTLLDPRARSAIGCGRACRAQMAVADQAEGRLGRGRQAEPRGLTGEQHFRCFPVWNILLCDVPSQSHLVFSPSSCVDPLLPLEG